MISDDRGEGLACGAAKLFQTDGTEMAADIGVHIGGILFQLRRQASEHGKERVGGADILLRGNDALVPVRLAEMPHADDAEVRKTELGGKCLAESNKPLGVGLAGAMEDGIAFTLQPHERYGANGVGLACLADAGLYLAKKGGVAVGAGEPLVDLRGALGRVDGEDLAAGGGMDGCTGSRSETGVAVAGLAEGVVGKPLLEGNAGGEGG